MPMNVSRALAAAVPGPPGTGFDVAGLVVIALGVIVLAVVAVIVLRRRDRGGS